MTDPHTMTDPDRIRVEIERTQDTLRNDVNALTEKVSPSRIAERRVQAARGVMTTVKERIMGTGSDAGSSVRDTVGSAASGVGSAASSAGDAISSAPRAARRSTQGNPLAAGVIAFGAGWLVSSLLPATTKEREVASTVRDRAGEQIRPVAQQLRQAGQEMADNLREPAKEAVESVKSTAGDAASTVADEAGSAKDQVAERTRQAKDNVAATAGSSDQGSERSAYQGQGYHDSTAGQGYADRDHTGTTGQSYTGTTGQSYSGTGESYTGEDYTGTARHGYTDQGYQGRSTGQDYGQDYRSPSTSRDNPEERS